MPGYFCCNTDSISCLFVPVFGQLNVDNVDADNDVVTAGNGVTGLAHLDGTDVRKGVQRMMTKLKHLCHGAPEGRLSIFCC